VRLAECSDDPWALELQLENALRAALGLESRALPADAPKRHVEGLDSPRARQWARVAAWKEAPQARVALFAGSVQGDDLEPALRLDVTAEDVRAGATLPRAPGSFGGTTMVVLPRELDAAQREAWIALEAEDPIAAKSRFSRLRVATLENDGERSLERMLERQVEERRRNVLLAPALFCADAATLAELRARAEAFEDRLDLAFRAGLGGL
jgi:hypothetical protein